MTASLSRRRVTLRDVAQAAGIAKSTASMALNGNPTIASATREAVARAAAELGFSPNVHAKRLNEPASSIVGVFCAGLEWSSGTRKLQIIQQLLTQHGFDAPAYIGTSDEASQKSLMGNLRQQQPRAIVCDTGGLGPEAIDELRQYHQNGGIVICHDRRLEDFDGDHVLFDRESSTYQAARYLLELGHRKIGFYNNGGSPFSLPRFSGFQRAHEEFGVPIHPEWMFSGDYEEGGALLAHQFAALPERPTGLYIVNDYAAAAFTATIQRAGLRVPHDVSVISSADMPVARHSSVPLTSMTYPYEIIAQQVVDLLASRLSGEESGPTREIVIGSALVLRDSTTTPERTPE